LGINNPVIDANLEYASSQQIASPLSEKIINHTNGYDLSTIASQSAAKNQVRLKKKAHHAASLEEVLHSLPDNMKRNIEAASEKGASSWLLTLPLKDSNTILHKSDFRDAICLRYNWQPPRLPSQCVCGKRFSVEHALSCHTGGLPS
jgi:hypothetical protein